MSSHSADHYDNLAKQAQRLIDERGMTLEEAAAQVGCAVSTLQRHGVRGGTAGGTADPAAPGTEIALGEAALPDVEVAPAQNLSVEDPTLAPPGAGKRRKRRPRVDLSAFDYKDGSRSVRLHAALAVAASRGKVSFIAGPVGIGKTEMLRKLADDPTKIGYEMPPGISQLEFVDLNAAEMADEAAVSGMPVAFGSADGDQEASVKHVARDVFQKLTKDAEQERTNEAKRSRGEPVPPEDEVAPTLLFIDELTSAAPEIQKPLLNLLSQRQTSYVTLPDSCIIVTAGNLAEHSGHADELTAAAWNRLTVHHMGYPEAGEWNQTWLKPLVDNSDEDDDIKDRMHHYGDVAEGFAIHNADFFDYMSSTTQDAVGTGPHASPRSVFSMVDQLAMVDCSGIKNPDQLRLNIAQGTIGEGFGGAFVTYARELDLPDPEDWLADPTKAEVYSGRFDKTTVAMRRLVAATKRSAPPGTEAPENWGNERLLSAFEVLCHINENSRSMTRDKREFVSLCQNIAQVLYNDMGLPTPTAKNRRRFANVAKRVKANFEDSIGQMLDLAGDVQAATKSG